MLHIPENLRDARILVTNDDGMGAEGIVLLEQIARSFSDDVWVVAPAQEQSGAGHSLTLHLPLRVEHKTEHHFTVSGTPTDCVLLATKEILPQDKPVALVLSGINRGCNIAEDVTYSGTIAGAMEGTLLGIPSIAFSQTVVNQQHQTVPHWETSEHYVTQVIASLRGMELPRGVFVSVNMPPLPVDEVKGVVVAPQGRRKLAEKLEKRYDPKGRAYYWIGGGGIGGQDEVAGSDHDRVRQGYVTVTPYDMDLTALEVMDALKARVE
jgi:5'-nucleotidase